MLICLLIFFYHEQVNGVKLVRLLSQSFFFVKPMLYKPILG